MSAYDNLKKSIDASAYSDVPAMPNYTGWTDANGNLSSQYQLAKGGALTPELQKLLAGITTDKGGIEGLRKEALRTGPSTWAQLMLQQQGLNQTNALDRTSKAANVAEAQARGEAAAHGGVSAAARERMATKAGFADMMGRQDVNRQGDMDRLSIGTTDEQNRLDMLKGLPAAEVAMTAPELQKAGLWANMSTNDRDYASKVDSFNISNAIGGVKSKQDFDMSKYSEQMKAWAANRTAGAQENAGKK